VHFNRWIWGFDTVLKDFIQRLRFNVGFFGLSFDFTTSMSSILTHVERCFGFKKLGLSHLGFDTFVYINRIMSGFFASPAPPFGFPVMFVVFVVLLKLARNDN
jgi:hypothetical protein